MNPIHPIHPGPSAVVVGRLWYLRGSGPPPALCDPVRLTRIEPLMIIIPFTTLHVTQPCALEQSTRVTHHPRTRNASLSLTDRVQSPELASQCAFDSRTYPAREWGPTAATSSPDSVFPVQAVRDTARMSEAAARILGASICGRSRRG